ncbi:MAG: NAD(P)H-hydrate epimerase [Planctomycetota bacterium]
MSAPRCALELASAEPSTLRPWTVAESRALDRAAVDELGLPSIVLMENAARALAAEALALCPEAPVLVLCGKGNNGGDGLALARLLAPRARVALLDRPDPATSPDAAVQLDVLERAGLAPVLAPAAAALADLAAGCGLVVDALLGTGLGSAPRGAVAEWIRAADGLGLPRLAADLPSGFDADRGHAFDPCLRADVTVSFARPKPGCFVDGRVHPVLGRLVVASIGLPEPWVEARDGRR